MHSTPSRKNKDDRRTRAEQYGEGHPYTCLPDVDGFDYLTGAFIEAGICDQGGMGLTALPWAELDCYARRTGSVYTDWDLQLIRSMSQEYVKWHARGGRQEEIADDVPYIDDSAEARDQMQRQLMESRERSAELAKEAESQL